MRLLLLSNSSNWGEPYLAHARPHIARALDHRRRVLFIPYAAVRSSFDDYVAAVSRALAPAGIAVDAVHRARDPVRAVERASAIVVGGGNTFCLLQRLYERELLAPIRARIAAGATYVGWSAGSNVACPTIRTTNDMPIVEPPSLAALGLVGFQINPHYTDASPPRHRGETRAERLQEFCLANPSVTVIGLREGSALRVDGEAIELIGSRRARLFRGDATRELRPGPVRVDP